ncbi:hypothetical protein QBC39DRAFT_437403 [Podospora conica]|nr:hypothetical protein QBC39DRAFT_437403 [Schizothecium conicum]
MNQPAAVHDENFKQLLAQPQGAWQGYIKSFEECIEVRQRLREQRLVKLDQNDDASDDFPYTPEAKMECAKQITEAIIDYTDFIEDKDQQNHHQVNRLRAMSGLEIEVLAWEILMAVENAYLGNLGFPALPDEVERKAKKNWRYRSFGSFGARFEQVKHACRVSKSVVYNLTTSPAILSLASDPVHQVGTKISNKILNDKRAKKNQAEKDQANPPTAPDQGVAAAGTNLPPADNLPLPAAVVPAPAIVEAGPVGPAGAARPSGAAGTSSAVPKTLSRTRAGRVAKNKPKATKSTKRTTRASSRAAQDQQSLAGAVAGRPAQASHHIAPAPGSSGTAEGDALEELWLMADNPVDPADRDAEYKETVKALLSKRRQERARGL